MPLSVLRGERAPGAKWTERDSDFALALTEYEGMLCSGCGHPVWESMDPDTQRDWEAPLPMRCHACTAIGERAKGYAKPEVPVPTALRFRAYLPQGA